VKAVQAGTLSEVWVTTLEHLLDQRDGKDINIVAAFPGTAEDPAIRDVLDPFLAGLSGQRPKAKVYEVDTVASTLFPDTWYVPDRAANPREHLYRMQRRAARVHRRISGEDETYFDRLVAYPSTDGGTVNQLEEQVLRLQGQLMVAGPKSSAYEIGVSSPADLRIQVPGKDHQYMGFPCLSHISLTLHHGAVHVTAVYRNQGFIRKAYGNYVGLSRLARFFARETGTCVGEITCIASHADAEISVGGKRALRKLVTDCRAVLGSQPVREVDRAA
jgi:hypothetical protein